MNEERQQLNAIPKRQLQRIKKLSAMFGYGEIKIHKAFPLTQRQSRKLVKGINQRDKRYETKSMELNVELLSNATHCLDITYPFHSGSLQKEHHKRITLVSIDNKVLIEVGLRTLKDMSIQRKRFKVIPKKKEEFSMEYRNILNVLISFNIPKGSLVVFDRYYKDLKKLENDGITPIVVKKSHEYFKKIDDEIRKIQRVYNSEAESIFANVAKRIYRSIDLWTTWIKIKKRWQRKALLTIDEMEELHIALCEMEDNNNPTKIMFLMDYIESIKEKREKELTIEIPIRKRKKI